MPDTPNTPAVPEYLKKYMAVSGGDSPAGATADTDSLVSSSMSVPRISLRAKKFRFMESGEELFAEPETHVVILGVEPGPGRFVKTFYDGPYNPGDTSPPTCASSDGIRPDPWITSPQNDFCNTCRNNVFGSAVSRSGKKAKACRDAKRLWVTRPDEIDGTVYGLQVPVTSLKNLSDLGVKIKATGLPLSAAVVKLSMLEDESFPVIMFDLAGWLHEGFGTKALERNQKKDWPGALTENNPPVPQNLVAQSTGAAAPPPASGARVPETSAAKVEASKPRVEKDGTIVGESVVVSNKAPDVDAALRTWG